MALIAAARRLSVDIVTLLPGSVGFGENHSPRVGHAFTCVNSWKVPPEPREGSAPCSMRTVCDRLPDGHVTLETRRRSRPSPERNEYSGDGSHNGLETNR